MGLEVQGEGDAMPNKAMKARRVGRRRPPRNNGRLYRGRWFIAFYDMDDELVMEVDNPIEFCERTGVGFESAYSTIGRMFPGAGSSERRETIFIGGRRCRAFFFEPRGNAALCSDPSILEGGELNA